MADPVGGNKFWFNGIPYTGVAKTGVDPSGVKFWFNGIPVTTLIPSGTPPPAKTYAAFSTPQHDGQVYSQMIGY